MNRVHFQVKPLFQSTLPRRERRQSPERTVYVSRVSIHAPAKGATTSYPHTYQQITSFNPRSREGSDAAGGTGVRR